MKVKEIAFVVYAVNDLSRARNFYENVLGLTASSVWGDGDSGMIEYEMGPHTLAIGKGADTFKVGPQGGCAALEVEDFEEAVATLKNAKVTFILEPYETSVCFMAAFHDTEGNTLMIHKRK